LEFLYSEVAQPFRAAIDRRAEALRHTRNSPRGAGIAPVGPP
jgi:hypothetical protein